MRTMTSHDHALKAMGLRKADLAFGQLLHEAMVETCRIHDYTDGGCDRCYQRVEAIVSRMGSAGLKVKFVKGRRGHDGR